MKMKRFFISGAHSTGKTTILNDLKEQNNQFLIEKQIVIEKEIARSIVKEWNIKQSDLSNVEIFKELQLEILKRQYELDKKNSQLGVKAYISDRGIDPLVYAKYKLDLIDYETVINSEYSKKMIEIFKSSLTFAILPHRECIQNDGIRYKPDWNDMILYHDTLISLLNEFQIPFYEITTLDRDNRLNFIINGIVNYLY